MIAGLTAQHETRRGRQTQAVMQASGRHHTSHMSLAGARPTQVTSTQMQDRGRVQTGVGLDARVK
jgi:hypothetical protein